MPSHFRVDDVPTLQDVIERHAFGILVSQRDGAPYATHLPFHLRRGDGERGTLYGHLARANPHWETFAGGDQALAIFQGEHGYVSPSWYEGAENVPTWNYVAVHAYGTPRLIDDEREVQRVLDDLVDVYESPRPQPWRSEVLSRDYLGRMRGAVVAFCLPIARIEGKFKLSQNRTPADRGRVIAALAASQRAEDRALAERMGTMSR
ncbi:MAG TPA: FMN-binding negative transcriptional regulator [Candidatus Dormibacteraeota bacterium]|nr:FMN-binding negative transcriptional regulator [Candidatus Dormibacteraeota bacterium]